MGLIDILVVDDSDAFIKLTRRSLEKAGVKCNIADVSNGRRALDYLVGEEKCPDVILLDMNMPVMDGFDFLAEYEQGHKCLDKTLVYMLTSSIMEKDKSKAQAYSSLRAYFEKPLTSDNINQILADIESSQK
jgi:CheY-like chemotaxis protein